MHEGLARRQLHTNIMLELTGGDEDGGTRGKADHHAVGDEIDQLAHACQAEGQLKSAGEEGQGQHHIDEIRAAGHREGLDRGQYHDGNRGGGPRDQVTRRTEQSRHDRRHDGSIETVLRRQAGDQGKSNTLGQHDDGAGKTRKEIGPQRLPAKQRPPPQKREYPAPLEVGHFEYTHMRPRSVPVDKKKCRLIHDRMVLRQWL